MTMITSRRGAGTGSITPRGDNRYRVQVDYGRDPVTGARIRRRFSVTGPKKAAEEALRKALTERDHGTDVKPERITVAEFMPRWIRDYVRPTVAPSTLRRYQQIADRVCLEIGSRRLQQLEPALIQAMYARLECGDAEHRPLTKRTVLHHHRVLGEALRHAVKWRLLAVNPVDATTPPHPDQHEMLTVKAVDFPRLLEAMPDDDLRRFAYVAVQTGARLGELLALRWSDIDLDAGRLSIQRSLEHFKAGAVATFRPPKTAKGRRSIALSPDTVRVLREHRVDQAAQRLRLGPDWHDHRLVFCDAYGLPAKKFNVSGRFIRAARAAGFEGLRFHDLRHTAATLMLGAGVHPKIVSERLGHSTIAITMDTYSHVLPDMQREAAAALDDALRLTSTSI